MKNFFYSSWLKAASVILIYFFALSGGLSVLSTYILRYYYDNSDIDAAYRYDRHYSIKLLVFLDNHNMSIFMFSILALIVLTGYLLWAAGHRRDNGAIAIRGIDKLWYEFLLCITILIQSMACAIIAELDYDLPLRFVFVQILLLTSVIYGAGMISFVSAVVRLKAHCFWRYTLLFFLYQKGQKIFSGLKVLWKQVGRGVRSNIPLLIRAGMAIAVIFLLEIHMCFRSIVEYGEGAFILFIFFNILLCAALFYFALQLVGLKNGTSRIASGKLEQPVNTQYLIWEFRDMGEALNRAAEGMSLAVQERMKSEHFRTELITNVSHDIKTPLTSIINYVDLMKKENVTDPVLLDYMEVLERQSARLKKLIEDLMEASKASTGNLSVDMKPCDVSVLFTQTVGEFEERAGGAGLSFVTNIPKEPVQIMADGRHLWRVFDNLLVNICKYALAGTRIYLDLILLTPEPVKGNLQSPQTESHDTSAEPASHVQIVFRNISREPLNMSSEELMQRFVRGDSSRSTAGNGLGLSIAQSLTELMGGTMELEIDGDLFKVILTFPRMMTDNAV